MESTEANHRDKIKFAPPDVPYETKTEYNIRWIIFASGTKSNVKLAQKCEVVVLNVNAVRDDADAQMSEKGELIGIDSYLIK